MKKDVLITEIEAIPARSAWRRGVKDYAVMMVENAIDDDHIEISDRRKFRKMLLNGAINEYDYSYGGCALIYDADIAKTLCTPSELKRTRNGERNPNRYEKWLDIQARALHQALNLATNTWETLR